MAGLSHRKPWHLLNCDQIDVVALLVPYRPNAVP